MDIFQKLENGEAVNMYSEGCSGKQHCRRKPGSSDSNDYLKKVNEHRFSPTRIILSEKNVNKSDLQYLGGNENDHARIDG